MLAWGIAADELRLSHRLVIKGDGGVQLSPGQFAVGCHTSLDGRFVIGAGGTIRIGSYCSLRAGSFVSAKVGVTIGSYVVGSTGIFISDNNNHPLSPAYRRQMAMTAPGSSSWKLVPDVAAQEVVIEDGVWIGKDAVILKGVRIGRWSIVGIRAVVTKDVPAFSVVVGNPARVVRTIHDDLDGPSEGECIPR